MSDRLQFYRQQAVAGQRYFMACRERTDGFFYPLDNARSLEAFEEFVAQTGEIALFVELNMINEKMFDEVQLLELTVAYNNAKTFVQEKVIKRMYSYSFAAGACHSLGRANSVKKEFIAGVTDCLHNVNPLYLEKAGPMLKRICGNAYQTGEKHILSPCYLNFA